MKLQLIRHATIIVTIKGLNILVDPMLCKKGEQKPIMKLTDFRRNPTIGLPFNMDVLKNLLDNIDAVFVTHMHRDHFDDMAAKIISKEKPIFCQIGDEIKLKNNGFKKVYPINESTSWNGIDIIRTNGCHGEKMEKVLGKVSGFVFKTQGEPSLYIAGDTIYYEDIDKVMINNRPDIIVVNSGAASLMFGGPITMTSKHIKQLCTNYKFTKIVAIHMEAFNHCKLTRKQLTKYLEKNNLLNNVEIPEDGEIMHF